MKNIYQENLITTIYNYIENNLMTIETRIMIIAFILTLIALLINNKKDDTPNS